MRASDYAALVRDTDWTSERPREIRGRILRYGVVGEIGSIIAAVKKRVLAMAGLEQDHGPSDEVAEELGDLLWYCFALYDFEHPDAERMLLAHGVQMLRAEIDDGSDRAEAIREWLGERDWSDFLGRAALVLDVADLGFNRYQTLAFLTARTRSIELVEVCMSVLSQLGAELLRNHLPPIEQQFNRSLPDRSSDVVLSEILWHLSALATLFKLRLADVAAANHDKLRFRGDRSQATPPHDRDARPSQRLPRRFTIHIVACGPGRSRMIWNGAPLGDDLTDNARVEDGYRFHDVMHLALAAKLGWSPVLRSLMGCKRKDDPTTDEVEDGARARIVEEAVIKIIHSEGVRVAAERGDADDGSVPLIAEAREISFGFLKLVRHLVAGLEAHRNRGWEWEDAIVEGHRLFQALRRHGEGAIVVDLDTRSIAFTSGVPDDVRRIALA